MGKIGRKGFFVSVAFAFCLAVMSLVSCSTYVSGRWITTKIPAKYNNPEFNYLRAKTIALESCGLVNFTPFLIGVERQATGYVFVFYAKEIDTVSRIFVSGDKGEGKVLLFEDEVVSGKKYDFLKNTDMIIDAERALNKVIKGDAKLKSPTEAMPAYTYSCKFTRTKDDDAFRVIFGTDKMEYDFAIKANTGDNKILKREIKPRDK